MKTVVIGKIVKPQGIKGEVKVVPLTDDPLRFRALKEAIAGGVAYSVENVRVVGRDVYLKFSEIKDRNAAESLRALDVEISENNAAPLEKGRYFIKDFIGIEFRDETGKIYGTIIDILQYGSADVIVLDSGMMIPYLAALELDVDLQEKVFIADSKTVKQTAVGGE